MNRQQSQQRPPQQQPPTNTSNQQGRRNDDQPKKSQQPQQPYISVPLTQSVEFRIGSCEVDTVESHFYPTMEEFLEKVDILKYETYAENLNDKDNTDYWSAEGIDHFSADLGIGISELLIYDLGNEWLVMAHAVCVTDGRPMCSAVTHPKKDKSALEKACRRAGRNARKYLIPLIELRYRLEQAKSQRSAEETRQAEIAQSRKQAGDIMREHRANFDDIATVPQLLEFAEQCVGKEQKDWVVKDWNFLSAGVGDDNSKFLSDLIQHLNPSDGSEEVEEEVQDFEQIAESIESDGDESDEIDMSIDN